ncbi:MAG: FkbM family methyltransferase [Acidobacteriota bacterium]|nr:FkbM family methyltransferase [Acidobacteriota bacterium]
MISINVHKDLVGSSLYKEAEASSVDGTERRVTAVALDSICHDEQTQGPYLIKIDVQGAELDVLRGASEILLQTEFIMMEVSLFEFFKGGPQFSDVVSFMKDKGFVCSDIYGFQYRPLDNALSQVDIAFVKENGRFRQTHVYATLEQRAIQNAQFMTALEKLGNRPV